MFGGWGILLRSFSTQRTDNDNKGSKDNIRREMVGGLLGQLKSLNHRLRGMVDLVFGLLVWIILAYNSFQTQGASKPLLPR